MRVRPTRIAEKLRGWCYGLAGSEDLGATSPAVLGHLKPDEANRRPETTHVAKRILLGIFTCDDVLLTCCPKHGFKFWNLEESMTQLTDLVCLPPFAVCRLPFAVIKPVLSQPSHHAPQRASAKRFGWRALRHTFETIPNANGVNSKVIQELLRHDFESHDGHLCSGSS